MRGQWPWQPGSWPDGYRFLDSREGTLSRNWADLSALQADLARNSGQDQYLLGGLALAVARAGLTLAPNEVYDLTHPPVLGGPMEVENVVAADFVVALDVAGQIFKQVKDLPPGTKIAGVNIQVE